MVKLLVAMSALKEFSVLPHPQSEAYPCEDLLFRILITTCKSSLQWLPSRHFLFFFFWGGGGRGWLEDFHGSLPCLSFQALNLQLSITLQKKLHLPLRRSVSGSNDQGLPQVFWWQHRALELCIVSSGSINYGNQHVLGMGSVDHKYQHDLRWQPRPTTFICTWR